MKKQQTLQFKGAPICGGKKKKKVVIFKLHFLSRLTTPFTNLTCKQVLNFKMPLRQVGVKLPLTGVGIFDKVSRAVCGYKGSSRCS